jgi:hypothetical protein
MTIRRTKYGSCGWSNLSALGSDSRHRRDLGESASRKLGEPRLRTGFERLTEETIADGGWPISYCIPSSRTISKTFCSPVNSRQDLAFSVIDVAVATQGHLTLRSLTCNRPLSGSLYSFVPAITVDPLTLQPSICGRPSASATALGKML